MGNLKDIDDKVSSPAQIHRLEALRDGVFAIISTLLVIEIHRPSMKVGRLGGELIHGWPSYLAYAVAFLYVGVVWLNHHYMYERIVSVSPILNWLNLFILGTVALILFPTGVLPGAYTVGSLADQKSAVVLYALIATLMSASWLSMFAYLNRNPQLLKADTPSNMFSIQMRRPLIGMFLYALAGVLGWTIHPNIAVAIFVFMVLYYAWTSQGISNKSHHNIEFNKGV